MITTGNNLNKNFVGNSFVYNTENKIVLLGGGGNAGAARNTTLRLINTTGGYTPSGTKKFICEFSIVSILAVAAADRIKFGYGDSDIGQNGVAAPANAVYIDSGSIGLASTSDKGIISNNMFKFEIPNGKYPFINIPTAVQCDVNVYGYEE